MKLLCHTTLLLAISFFIFSCKTKQDHVMTEHYNSVNKYSTLENKLLRDNNDLLLNASTTKSNNQFYDNSVNLQLYQSQVKANEYKVLYDDSDIVNGDVYKDAAAHRQTLVDKSNANNKDCNCNSSSTKAGSSVKTEANTPEFFATLTDIDKKSTRNVGISFVDASNSSLMKSNSVVIASFYQPEKMATLKKALTSSGDELFFVKNDSGIYYAIFGSYKTENEAMQKVKRIRMEYTSLYTPEQLNNKYGITFTDLYILKR